MNIAVGLGILFAICVFLPLASFFVDALLLRAVRKYIARHPELVLDVTRGPKR